MCVWALGVELCCTRGQWDRFRTWGSVRVCVCVCVCVGVCVGGCVWCVCVCRGGA